MIIGHELPIINHSIIFNISFTLGILRLFCFLFIKIFFSEVNSLYLFYVHDYFDDIINIKIIKREDTKKNYILYYIILKYKYRIKK